MKSNFDIIFEKCSWGGESIAKDVYNSEMTKWLRFIDEKSQLQRFLPRLNIGKSAKRAEALAEIITAYHMGRNLGIPITDWEPRTNGDRNVEFVLDGRIYCEVKSPGWESELTDEEIKKGRTAQPKYISAEARSIGPYLRIQYAVEKAYPKFLGDKENLLIIVDDLFMPVLTGGFYTDHNIDVALFNNRPDSYGGLGCFHNDAFKNIGAVVFLNLRIHDGALIYTSRLEKNSNALISCSLTIPDRLLQETIAE